LEVEFDLLHRKTAGSEQSAKVPEGEECLANLYSRIHSLATPRSALCLSGGGIRSATFSLGVLQGLAARGLLNKFDYLSTVSGGGYIGSWLTAWIHRHPKGLDGVCDELRGGCADGANRSHPGRSASAPLPETTGELAEPAEIAHLRRYSNYLTPRVGLTSGDTWVLVAIYLRNLLLNWLVLLPLLAIFLLLPRLYAVLVAQVGDSTWRVAGLSGANRLFGTQPRDWVQLAGMGISMLPLVSLVICLPSTRQRDTLATAGDPPEPSKEPNPVSSAVVFWSIYVPVILACALATLDYAWRVYDHLKNDGQLPDPPPLLPALRFVAGFYASAAFLAWLLMRLMPRWKKSLKRPRWYFLIAAYVPMGVLASFLIRGLRTLPWMRDPSQHLQAYVVFAVPALLGVYLLTLTLYVGLTSRGMRPEDDDDREWLARLMGNVLIFSLGWITLASIALWGPYVVKEGIISGEHPGWFWTITAIFIVSIVVGLLGGRSESSGGREGMRGEGWRPRIANILPDFAARFSVLVVLLLLSAGVNALYVSTSRAMTDDRWKTHGAVVTTWHNEAFTRIPSLGLRCMDCTNRSLRIAFIPKSPEDFPGNSWRCAVYLVVVIAGLFLVVLLLGTFMNFNRLSLHSTYRNRLMRAYLGASNPGRRPASDSMTDPFTGFNSADNLPMHYLRRCGQFRDDDLDMAVPGNDCVGATTVWRALAQCYLEKAPEQMDDEAKRLAFRFTQRWMGALGAKGDGTLSKWYKEEKCSTLEPSVKLAIKDSLNKLLCDPKLIHYTWFNSTPENFERMLALHDPAKQPDHGKAGVIREVNAAYWRMCDEGSPVLLNRLILEDVCCFKGVHPLRAVSALQKPFHVVNMTLNLVAGKNLAWQQRKAASFITTPLHSGFYKGYRRSVDYGGGITLGTALTISGAAATPNMGYHSSPAVTFLMTLFNARLGWWLGNPSLLPDGTPPATGQSRAATARTLSWSRRQWDFLVSFLDRMMIRIFSKRKAQIEIDGQTYRLPCPRHSLRPLVDEALGRTNYDNDYVYLSDGGHFENIGLYEMIRRRCRYIVVVDASCDEQFKLDDFANAIRKVRVDLGVNIRVNQVTLLPEEKDMAMAKSCVVGTIEYSSVDRLAGSAAADGHLIYLKPIRYAAKPVDVYNYARARRQFPHESTINQWFSESQFESYRKLGQELVEEICKARGDGGGVDHDAVVAADNLRKPPTEFSLPMFHEAAVRKAAGGEHPPTFTDSKVNKVLASLDAKLAELGETRVGTDEQGRTPKTSAAGGEGPSPAVPEPLEEFDKSAEQPSEQTESGNGTNGEPLAGAGSGSSE